MSRNVSLETILRYVGELYVQNRLKDEHIEAMAARLAEHERETGEGLRDG